MKHVPLIILLVSVDGWMYVCRSYLRAMDAYEQTRSRLEVLRLSVALFFFFLSFLRLEGSSNHPLFFLSIASFRLTDPQWWPCSLGSSLSVRSDLPSLRHSHAPHRCGRISILAIIPMIPSVRGSDVHFRVCLSFSPDDDRIPTTTGTILVSTALSRGTQLRTAHFSPFLVSR